MKRTEEELLAEIKHLRNRVVEQSSSLRKLMAIKSRALAKIYFLVEKENPKEEIKGIIYGILGSSVHDYET